MDGKELTRWEPDLCRLALVVSEEIEGGFKPPTLWLDTKFCYLEKKRYIRQAWTEDDAAILAKQMRDAADWIENVAAPLLKTPQPPR